jgi:hypothetical protein
VNGQLKWACVSASTCVGSFFAYAIPTLQIIALTISILAGAKALLHRK